MAYIEGCKVQASMQQQHLSGAGETYLLEQKLATYYRKKFALTFCNATTALQTLCLAFDLVGAEIITSPINWGGSIAPFLLRNNRLRFTSFDPTSLHLSIPGLSSAFTAKTKAVLSVDYQGVPVNSKAIKEFCSAHNLVYISDSAQSLGAFRDNKPGGFYADATVLSFSPGKSLFGGEGGAILTDDEALYEKLLWFSQHPSRQKAILGLSHYNEYAPLNGRMNPLSAILLNSTFEDSTAALKHYQTTCFEVLHQLQKAHLIKETRHIPSHHASTFFNFMAQLMAKVCVQQVNEFLLDHRHPFVATASRIKLIPFDDSFIKQFRGRFSCTKELKEQKSAVRFEDWITLDYMDEG